MTDQKRKVGRPPGRTTPAEVTVMLTVEQAAWVRRMSEASGDAMSATIRRLIAQAMESTP